MSMGWSRLIRIDRWILRCWSNHLEQQSIRTWSTNLTITFLLSLFQNWSLYGVEKIEWSKTKIFPLLTVCLFRSLQICVNDFWFTFTRILYTMTHYRQFLSLKIDRFNLCKERSNDFLSLIRFIKRKKKRQHRRERSNWWFDKCFIDSLLYRKTTPFPSRFQPFFG